VMKRHLEAPVPPVRAQVPGVPIALEALIVRMMAKDPVARPSAEEVRKAVGRLKHDARRFDPSPELTQLEAPLTRITAPPVVTPNALPATLPDGTPAVLPAAAVTAPAGVVPVRPDPALLVTRPDRVTSRATLAEVQLFLEGQGLRKAPLIMIALGLALLGGAVGILFFQPSPSPSPQIAPIADPVPVVEEVPAPPAPDPIVEVDPPRRTPSRVEVERSLSSSRTRLSAVSPASRRRALSIRLGKLEDRLRKNEAPAVVAQQLEKLLADYGVK